MTSGLCWLQDAGAPLKTKANVSLIAGMHGIPSISLQDQSGLDENIFLPQKSQLHSFIVGPHFCLILLFLFVYSFIEMVSHFVAQDSLQFLDSSHPPTSAFQGAGPICMHHSPWLAPQFVEISEVEERVFGSTNIYV